MTKDFSSESGWLPRFAPGMHCFLSFLRHLKSFDELMFIFHVLSCQMSTYYHLELQKHLVFSKLSYLQIPRISCFLYNIGGLKQLYVNQISDNLVMLKIR